MVESGTQSWLTYNYCWVKWKMLLSWQKIIAANLIPKKLGYQPKDIFFTPVSYFKKYHITLCPQKTKLQVFHLNPQNLKHPSPYLYLQLICKNLIFKYCTTKRSNICIIEFVCVEMFPFQPSCLGWIIKSCPYYNLII